MGVTTRQTNKTNKPICNILSRTVSEFLPSYVEVRSHLFRLTIREPLFGGVGLSAQTFSAVTPLW